MSTNSPTLEKTLGLRGVVLFGLAYMTPIIVLGIFGVIAVASDGASAGAYSLALGAMLFTALSYGLMAKQYPVAGSAYTYVRRALDARAGFVVGWTVLLDYLFLPLVIWLIGGAYLNGQFPDVPMWMWIVGFVVITTALNIIGLQVADKANFALMTFQVLVLIFFVVLALVYLINGSASLFSVTPFVGGSGLSGAAAGAAIAAYSFLGFDAVSTLTEDTKDPEKTIPRAIFLVALIGGLVFVVVSYVVSLVAPGAVFDNADSLAADLAVTIGGAFFGAIFLAGLIIGQFTSGLAAQASAARLMYAMGRDGVLPKGFSVGSLSVSARRCSTSCSAVLSDSARSSSTSPRPRPSSTLVPSLHLPWSTLQWWLSFKHRDSSLSKVRYLIFPIIGAVVDLYLLTQLDGRALTVGAIWLLLGLTYLLVITRGFSRPTPDMNSAAM
ncbi:APC family permease [Ornithinimicrobium sp. INDO-MA30-4]|uniref:APC family permease n=1 Tax=Ornithinimicrobium sp. INDO-MA30-4 TaxID=2908651 RepID=UPI001F26D424|nr:APC family permease [Ornithinimicrobium sp. INDO-MA30-4]UJH71509.1 APC family permease [Ornithinimicrobium sp. INDO-MA30-4]